MTTKPLARHRALADAAPASRTASTPQHRGGLLPRAVLTALMVTVVLLAAAIVLIGVLGR